jgi:hypothetical protein
MSAPSLVPPADLLQQVEGIERGLRRGRRLGIFGWIAFIASSAQLVSSLRTLDSARLADQWPLYLSAFALVLSLLLINWTRFWLKESKEPFRYTFSIDEFVPGAGDKPDQRLGWLRHDLLEKLSTRIRRLSLLNEDDVPDDTDHEDTSHIHVSGSYAIRQTPEGRWIIHVHPWVRVGGRGRPAKLAHPVTFRLIRKPSTKRRPTPTKDEYRQVLERTHFSVATEIYKQIRHDVQRKIDLLPTSYFRASAYFHEAEDYVRSNTLDAYDDARILYEAAARVYDRRWRALSESKLRRFFQRLRRRLSDVVGVLRRLATWIWPRMGVVDLMVVRAQLGYASTLLYRRILAGYYGQRLNPVFEAWPVADRARRTLENMPTDVPGQTESLFDAYVTCALAKSQLGDPDAAKAWLDRARREQPFRGDEDARFLFVAGEAEGRLLSALQFYRRAAELDPAFEVAQFQLANSFEMLWRTRPTFEDSVAKMVFDEYDRVVTDNPGNVSAWASIGYMRWLLEQWRESEHAYESGRDYKEIKRETFVGELDYGLARIAAEQGRFKDAYEHYIAAASALIAEGVSHAPYGYSGYQFAYIDKEMLSRYERYRGLVEDHWRTPSPAERRQTTPRVRDSVYGFVLNDHADACLNYYLRSGDETYLDRAEESLTYAAEELKTKYLLVYYNLYRLSKARGEDGGRYIEKVNELEPNWPDGNLEMVLYQSRLARNLRQTAIDKERMAANKKEQADEKRTRAKKRREAPSVLDQFSFPSRGATGQPAPYSLDLAETLHAVGQTATQTEALVSSDDPEARRMRDDAVKLEREASDLNTQAGELRDQARKLQEKAQDLPKTLLPHRWLWSPAAHRGRGAYDVDGPRLFDAGALTRKDFERELKWEREFDDFHVRALFTWGRALATVARDGSDDDLAPPIDPRTLLDHIRRRFWPNDFELLREYQELCAAEDDEAPESTAKLAAIVDRWLTRDPAAFWALNWVDVRGFDPTRGTFTKEDTDRVTATFARVADLDGLSPLLYRWLGDQLQLLGADQCALTAYKNGRMAVTDAASLVELGTRLEGVRGREEALQAYEEAEAAERPTERVHSTAFYRWRIGRVRWALGDYDRAVADLASVGAGDHDIELDWRFHLVNELASSGELDREARERHLRPWLEAEQLTSASPELAAVREGAARALLALARDSTDSGEAGAREDVADARLVMRALRLEADSGLFPERSDGGRGSLAHRMLLRSADEPEHDIPEAARRMIESDIPAIQDRIREETGVLMPGINIRANTDIGEGRYRIFINEIERANGVVLPNQRYCRDADACRGLGLSGQPGIDPTGDSTGVWLREDAARLAEHEGLPLLDPYDYMLEHVAAVFRDHLALFIDFESVRRLLDDWASEQVERAMRDGRTFDPQSTFRDDHAVARFAQMLERLVDEGVPIVDLDALVDAFAAAGGPDVEVRVTVEAARSALAASLPGTDAFREPVHLPPSFEEAVASGVRTIDGKRFLALPPSELELLQGEVRELVGDRAATIALVVETDGLRPFARRVVALEFPTVPVVAEDELIAARAFGLAPAIAMA